MVESISLKVKFAGTKVGQFFGRAGNDLADGFALTALRAGGVETGNVYHAFARPIVKRGGAIGRASKGIPVPALAASLPSTATLVVEVDKKVTEITVELQDSVSNGGKGKPQKRYQGVQQLPGLGKKSVLVYATDLGDGVWNIDACINGVSGGGGKKTASVETLKALF